MSNQQIQKVKVKRLAHVGLWASDVSAQARFYRQVLGFDLHSMAESHSDTEAEIEEAGVFLTLGEDHYRLGLFSDTRPQTTNGRKPAVRVQLHHLSFEVDSDAELAALAARLQMAGVEMTLSSRDDDPEQGNILWFNDPDGNRIEISATSDNFRVHPPARGRRALLQPYSLQHIALNTSRLEAMIEFYTEALGFDISDWLLRECAWLRCNSNHHTLILAQGKPGIDHIGYHIADGAELLRWADYLSQHQIPLLWGPGRHGAGNDLFMRVVDPEGIHVELSAEMQQYCDRDVTSPPRLWHTRSMAFNLWGTMPAWMRESLHEVLDFVDEVLDDLGTRNEINYIRNLLSDPRGTGADRQIAVYKETGDIEAVVRFLIEQTVSSPSMMIE